MIPYVISQAYPDYKRPSLYQDFGVVKEEEMYTYFLDRICEFILDRIDDTNLKCCEDIHNFFENYYDEYYMDNPPWEAMVFINDEWENVTPSYEKIWEHIQLMKLEENEDKEKENMEKEDVKKEHSEKEEEIELQEDEKLLLVKIKEFFEQMLKEKPLPSQHIESLKKLTEIQQLTSLFNIYMTDENFKKNQHLFHGFLNLCVKLVQKDIELITKKLESEHSEELSKQLQNALVVYSNALFVKQTFNI